MHINHKLTINLDFLVEEVGGFQTLAAERKDFSSVARSAAAARVGLFQA
jgi:hypothetical protein